MPLQLQQGLGAVIGKTFMSTIIKGHSGLMGGLSNFYAQHEVLLYQTAHLSDGRLH